MSQPWLETSQYIGVNFSQQRSVKKEVFSGKSEWVERKTNNITLEESEINKSLC